MEDNTNSYQSRTIQPTPTETDYEIGTNSTPSACQVKRKTDLVKQFQSARICSAQMRSSFDHHFVNNKKQDDRDPLFNNRISRQAKISETISQNSSLSKVANTYGALGKFQCDK